MSHCARVEGIAARNLIFPIVSNECARLWKAVSPSVSTTRPNSGHLTSTCARCRRSRHFHTSILRSSLVNGNGSAERGLAIVLEIEGVIVDLHKHGHRQAFNRAFQELGLDCANWSQPLYNDLWRVSGGNEEVLVRHFFTTTGWPSTLSTAEYGAFVGNVLAGKRRALSAAVPDLPLKPGLEEFLREAQAAGSSVALISAYAKCGENVGQALATRLKVEGGLEREVVVVDEAAVESSAYGQVVLGEGTLGSLDEMLAAQVAEAVAAERQRVAGEVAAQLNVSVDLDSVSTLQSKRHVAALRAAAEALRVPTGRCVMVAGTHGGLQAALRCGMPCVCVRSSATQGAAFPQARATVEGFGPGTLTYHKLERMLGS